MIICEKIDWTIPIDKISLPFEDIDWKTLNSIAINEILVYLAY